jgi:hypothetical protein
MLRYTIPPPPPPPLVAILTAARESGCESYRAYESRALLTAVNSRNYIHRIATNELATVFIRDFVDPRDALIIDNHSALSLPVLQHKEI